MVKSSLALLIMVTIAGCAAQAPAPILTPVKVKLPIVIPVYCQVAKIDKPTLPIAALKSDSAPDDTIRAYAATVAILKGAVRQRDLVIAGCAAPPRDETHSTITGPATARVPTENTK